jgi:hypothetical protein
MPGIPCTSWLRGNFAFSFIPIRSIATEKKSMITVPKTSSEPNVTRLIAKMGLTTKPLFVPVFVDADAEYKECYQNVSERVKKMGGDIVYGWQLWNTGMMLEAECHAIWRTKAGELVDITPKQIDTDTILYIEDERIEYKGQQIANIRINVSANPLVDDYIDVLDAKFRFENLGERATQSEVTLKGEDIAKYQILDDYKYVLEVLINHNESGMSRCACGGNAKYKDCHGKNLKENLSALLT